MQKHNLQWFENHIGQEIGTTFEGSTDTLTVVDQEHAEILFENQDNGWEYEELVNTNPIQATDDQDDDDDLLQGSNVLMEQEEIIEESQQEVISENEIMTASEENSFAGGEAEASWSEEPAEVTVEDSSDEDDNDE